MGFIRTMPKMHRQVIQITVEVLRGMSTIQMESEQKKVTKAQAADILTKTMRKQQTQAKTQVEQSSQQRQQANISTFWGAKLQQQKQNKTKKTLSITFLTNSEEEIQI